MVILSVQGARPQSQGEQGAGAQVLEGFATGDKMMIHAPMAAFLNLLGKLARNEVV
jgi:hypothetical protein